MATPLHFNKDQEKMVGQCQGHSGTMVKLRGACDAETIFPHHTTHLVHLFKAGLDVVELEWCEHVPWKTADRPPIHILYKKIKTQYWETQVPHDQETG